MRRWKPDNISDWAVATFGDGATDQSVCARAMLEFAELNFMLVSPKGRDWAKIRAECADVYIVMARYAKRKGVAHEIDDWVERESMWTSRVHSIDQLMSQASIFLLGCQHGFDMKIALTGLLARMRQICALHGGDLWDEVDKKMDINTARTWRLDEHGHGQHVD